MSCLFLSYSTVLKSRSYETEALATDMVNLRGLQNNQVKLSTKI